MGTGSGSAGLVIAAEHDIGRSIVSRGPAVITGLVENTGLGWVDKHMLLPSGTVMERPGNGSPQLITYSSMENKIWRGTGALHLFIVSK